MPSSEGARGLKSLRFDDAGTQQLPITAGVTLRTDVTAGNEVTAGDDVTAGAAYPHLEGWFVAMGTVEGYAGRVEGDAYSWAAAAATFQRMKASNLTDTAAEERATAGAPQQP